MTAAINPATLLSWLRDEAGVPADRAAGAAAELADSWNDGDLSYQTARDILGDHLAAHVGLDLVG